MTGKFSIRPTTSADMGEIDALLGRAYPALLKGHYKPSLMVTAIPLLAKANPRLVASGRYFAVVDESGAIVGAGGWSGEDPRLRAQGAPTTGHIRHVVTDHRLVRAGIGRALMAHIFEDARGAGILRLDCLSTLMAVPFYAACGFEAAGEVTIELRPGIGFPAILMHRAI